MTEDYTAESALQHLIEGDAVGQLRRHTGLMAALGSEDGVLKLDWVEGVSRLLADPSGLERIEADARAIWQRGIRHIIWAGMGGSILTVQVLRALGFCSGCDDTALLPLPPEEFIVLHPLDSTDPAALNAIVRRIALAKHLELDAISEPAFLQVLLQDVLMVGVAMGMTSEEPITHLEWFTDLLRKAELRPAEHLLVMTLPGSYLDHFAYEQQAPSFPLQPDGGTGTGGRMSAPSTRVFLLPAALFLTRLSEAPGQLRLVLRRAWDEYNLDLAVSSPAAHPFVQLAAALCEASRRGVCRLLLHMPAEWHILVSWIEQLMEESLGKGGKGIVVFDDQSLNDAAPLYRREGTLRVQVVTDMGQTAQADHFILLQRSLASQSPQERLAALAASFLGWQLCMALYGYVQRIPFAGQPAVENYKARARALRTKRDPLLEASQWQPKVRDGILTLLAPPEALRPAAVEPGLPQPGSTKTAAEVLSPELLARVFTAAVRQAGSPHGTKGSSQECPLHYLDVTFNGMAPADMLEATRRLVNAIGNEGLGVPVKLRVAPAAYHSTEQSEMDGPVPLVSLRLVARDGEPCLLGSYTTAFLHAQAVSTWQAMLEQGRICLLLIIDGSLHDAAQPLATFFAEVKESLYSLQ
jgi:hypothetical protein